MFNNELFLLRFGKYMKQLLSIKEKALKIVKSVRASTAAGINISLLPRDCSCGGFACSAVWGRDLFPGIRWISCGAVREKASFLWHSCGFCRKRLCGSAIRGGLFLAFMWHLPVVPSGKDLFSLAFLAFGTFGTGEGLLWYGICARCAKQASVLRDVFSEHSV